MTSSPARDPQTPPPRSSFRLPRAARLRTAREFRRVYGRGVRAHGKAIVVVAFERRAPGHRLGVSVSKEHGRAVRRNKLKRILREAFRLERPELPGRYDVILIPRKSDDHLQLETVRNELRQLLQKVASGKGRKRGRPRGRPRKGQR